MHDSERLIKRMPLSRRSGVLHVRLGILAAMLIFACVANGPVFAQESLETPPETSADSGALETPTTDPPAVSTSPVSPLPKTEKPADVTIPVLCFGQTETWGTLQERSSFVPVTFTEENREHLQELYKESTTFWLENGNLSHNLEEWEAFSLGLMFAMAPMLHELDRERRVSNSLAIKRLARKNPAWLPEDLAAAMEAALHHYERGRSKPEAFSLACHRFAQWLAESPATENALAFAGVWISTVAAQAAGEGVDPAQARAGRLLLNLLGDVKHHDPEMKPALESMEQLLTAIEETPNDGARILEGVLDVARQVKTCCRKKHLDL